MQLKPRDGYILVIIFFWFFLILTPLGVFNDWVSPEIHKGFYSITQIDQGDDTGYYAFLRSLFFDGDIDFFNEKNYAHFVNITSTGFAFNNWQIGQGILFFPFFLVGHLLATILNNLGFPVSVDGYSTPYYLSTAIASQTYLFLGLLQLNRLIKKYSPENIALIAVIAIWSASPLLYYSFIRQRMAHTTEFFMAVLFVSAWLKKRESKDFIDHSFLGALLGFFCVVRIINITFFFLYFIDQILLLRNDLIAGEKNSLKGFINRSFLLILSFFIVLSPQLFIWQILNGTPLPTRHFTMASSSLSLLFSIDLFKKFLDIFFSFKWGLIFSFPILIISIIGLFLEKRFKNIKPGVLVYLASIFFIVAVYPEKPDSYGERHFISSMPLLALGFIGALKWAQQTKLKKYLFYYLTAFCIIWQYILIIEYKTYLFYDDPQYSINALSKIKTIIEQNPYDLLRSSNIFKVILSPKPIVWSYEDYLILIAYPLTQLIFLISTVFLFQPTTLSKIKNQFSQASFLIKGFVFFSTALLSFFLITIEKKTNEEQKRRKEFHKIINATGQSISKLNFTKAIELGLKSNKIYPNHWLPHLQIGASWQHLGNLTNALKSYHKAIKGNPENFFALSRMGEIYFQQKNWALAKTYLINAKSINPVSSKIYNYLGQTEAKNKNFNKAEEMFLTAIKLNSKSGDFHANLALVYFITTKHKKAISQLIQAKLLGFENHITKKLFKFYGIKIIKSKIK